MTETTNPSTRPPAKSTTEDLVLPVTGRDREFLPAALEILETPPAPLKTATMLTICTFFAAMLVWASVGRLDIHAVAWGKIEAEGKTKVVQPLDPGKVMAMAVEDGSPVKRGDLLVTFDSSETVADAAAAENALAAEHAEIARRSVAVAIAKAAQADLATRAGDKVGAAPLIRPGAAPNIGPDAVPDAEPAIPPAVRDRENAVLAADLAQLDDTLKSLGKQIVEKTAARRRLEMSIEVQRSLIATQKERVAMRESSLKGEFGSRTNLLDAIEALQRSQAALASDEGQLSEIAAAVDELKTQQIKTLSQFIADNEEKRAEADRKADETTQQRAKATARLERMTLVSPVDGVVQQVAITTIGQVVTTGQQLMTITPSGGALHVEAFVANADIGFVHLGQDAEIKIDSFPFTRFGVLPGRVSKIGANAVDEQEAKRIQANTTAGANAANTNPATTPGQPQNFVFPVTITLERPYMVIADAKVPLTPGMTVTAEIKTDSRSVIDYLLSPIAKVSSEALKER